MGRGGGLEAMMTTCSVFCSVSKQWGLAASVKMVSFSCTVALPIILPHSPAPTTPARCGAWWYLAGRWRRTLLLWHTWTAVLPATGGKTNTHTHTHAHTHTHTHTYTHARADTCASVSKQTYKQIISSQK